MCEFACEFEFLWRSEKGTGSPGVEVMTVMSWQTRVLGIKLKSFARSLNYYRAACPVPSS